MRLITELNGQLEIFPFLFTLAQRNFVIPHEIHKFEWHHEYVTPHPDAAGRTAKYDPF